jgi:Sec23/Sec24 trunk domain
MDPYINCGNENLRCATDGGVVFSSTKCPPPNPNPMSGRLEQTCELPFGYCYTPMINLPQQLSTSISPTNLPAGVMCKKCMTYLNLYCDTSDIFLDAGNENCMMRWTCVLCKSENIISVENSSKDLEEQGTEKLLDAIISQRVVEILQPLTRPPFKSNATTTTVDLSEQSTKTIILVVDGNLSSSEAHAVGHALQSVLDQKQRGNSISWQIGLIVFGKSISIYKLGVVNSGIVVADVVRSHEGFTMLTDVDSGSNIFCHSYLGTSVEALVSCLTAQFSPDENSSKDNDFTSNADVGSSNENGPKKTRLQILKERKHFRLQRQEIDSEPSRSSGTIDCHDSPWTQARERIAQSKPPYRCTGDAVLCALDLASLVASSFRSLDTTKSVFHESRILLFTNGCPNLGEGSVVDIKNDATGGLAAYSTVDSAQMARACSFYNVIGKSAVDVGVGIDIFCTGSSELGFPAYLSLVEASSGYVISHDTFASTRLQFNLGYILQHTHMSRSYKSDSSNLPDTSQPIGDACINGCLVDLRMSR